MKGKGVRVGGREKGMEEADQLTDVSCCRDQHITDSFQMSWPRTGKSKAYLAEH